MNKCYINIIGAGAIVENTYLPAIKFLSLKYHNIYVKQLIDKNIKRAEFLSKKFNIKNFSDTVINNLIDKNDVFILATPPETHFLILDEIAKYNKPILCEKPLLISLEEFKKLEMKIKTYPLLGAYLKRLFPSVEIVKRIRKMNLLGKLLTINIYDGFVFKWNMSSNYFNSTKDAGSVLLDIGSHDLDLLLYILDLDLYDLSIDILEINSDFLLNENNIEGKFIINNQYNVNFKFSRTNKLSNRMILYFENGIIMLPLIFSDKIEMRVNEKNLYLSLPENNIISELETTNDCFVKEIKMLSYLINISSSKLEENILYYKRFKNTIYLIEKLLNKKKESL